MGVPGRRGSFWLIWVYSRLFRTCTLSHPSIWVYGRIFASHTLSMLSFWVYGRIFASHTLFMLWFWVYGKLSRQYTLLGLLIWVYSGLSCRYTLLDFSIRVCSRIFAAHALFHCSSILFYLWGNSGVYRKVVIPVLDTKKRQNWLPELAFLNQGPILQPILIPLCCWHYK